MMFGVVRQKNGRHHGFCHGPMLTILMILLALGATPTLVSARVTHSKSSVKNNNNNNNNEDNSAYDDEDTDINNSGSSSSNVRGGGRELFSFGRFTLPQWMPSNSNNGQQWMFPSSNGGFMWHWGATTTTTTTRAPPTTTRAPPTTPAAQRIPVQTTTRTAAATTAQATTTTTTAAATTTTTAASTTTTAAETTTSTTTAAAATTAQATTTAAAVTTTAPPSAIAIGDPHFKTWGERWYDFHGQCDLIFMTIPDFANGLGMDIHIRTTIRDDFSYIEAAAIKIGDDILEVAGWGEYMINGVDGAEFPVLLADMFELNYTMLGRKKHKFEIPLSNDASGSRIDMLTVQDLVTVKIVNTTHDDFGTSMGLMGEYGSGRLVGRDGRTDYNLDYNGFGQEWQVRQDEVKLFDTPREPQHPNVCQIPTPRASSGRRRLGESMARAAAEKACAHWGDAMKLCVFDVMATGDLDVAGSM